MRISAGAVVQYIPGTGTSALIEGTPSLVLFEPGATKFLEAGTELDGSISHGETLFRLVGSTSSSHLTCKNDPNM